ncbi:restriction endonuclease [Methanococcoides alaskense]|uniref:Restriction endonuclease type IV Mrr domain-containing protein n=1 Tax=Methanococcoides alaskense TaxID=325778 RepID=A0AA90Z6T3_9EURY|nr:restriction endonuclease [Methanococcoides alaskense]MDA0524900.1 restriction endonuclease [Methanococcoides alaskense]MDR6222185.1 hypothetical protein [Methanococcoides alaskense]
MKKENSGLFLELWLYHSLKTKFQETELIGIHHGVSVSKDYQSQVDSVDDLLRDSEINTGSTITEVDVLITKNNEPYCIIECKCKDKGNVGMPDVLKLKGTMSLLGVEKGILFTKNFRQDLGDSQVFENIYVIQDVLIMENILDQVFDIISSNN